MDLGKLAQLIQALVAVIQAVCWPLLVLLLLLFFLEPIKKFLNALSEISFKAGGVETTLRARNEATALLTAAAASRGEMSGSDPSAHVQQAREIADLVNQAFQPHLVRRLSEASLLWVDDAPQNNLYERRALEALGLHISLSPGTDDALEKLRARRYDVIISDMGRPPDPQAGYTLLQQKPQLNQRTPYIIYSSSDLPEHRAQARQKGAFGSTNHPQELLQLVLSALGSS